MGLFQNFKDLLYADYEDEEIEESNQTHETRKEQRQHSTERTMSVQATARLQISMFRPLQFEEATDAVDLIAKGQAIVLNIENTDDAIARRIMDFLSGAAYLAASTITRISTRTYLILPSHMNLDEAEINSLENWSSTEKFSACI